MYPTTADSDSAHATQNVAVIASFTRICWPESLSPCESVTPPSWALFAEHLSPLFDLSVNFTKSALLDSLVSKSSPPLYLQLSNLPLYLLPRLVSS
jgi:hypothetical protein